MLSVPSAALIATLDHFELIFELGALWMQFFTDE